MMISNPNARRLQGSQKASSSYAGLCAAICVRMSSIVIRFAEQNARHRTIPAAVDAVAADGDIALMSPEQSAREARALAEIVQRINQSLELDRVFALIVRHAAELLHARGARLGLVEEGSMVIAATHGDPGDLAITDDKAFGNILLARASIRSGSACATSPTPATSSPFRASRTDS